MIYVFAVGFLAVFLVVAVLLLLERSAHRRQQPIVLALLAEHGELYGLELIRLSSYRIKRGGVYVLLGKLEESGLVTSRAESRRPGYTGLLRRLYRLTPEGLRKAAVT